MSVESSVLPPPPSTGSSPAPAAPPAAKPSPSKAPSLLQACPWSIKTTNTGAGLELAQCSQISDGGRADSRASCRRGWSWLSSSMVRGVASRTATSPPSGPADDCPRARCAVSEYSANEDESAGGSASSSRLRAQCDAVRCIAADADPTTLMVLAADSCAGEDARSGAAATQVYTPHLRKHHHPPRTLSSRLHCMSDLTGSPNELPSKRAQRRVKKLPLDTLSQKP